LKLAPDLSPNAPWKQRYRAAKIQWVRIANLRPERGLVCSDLDGIMQLYAWDVPSGELRLLTQHPVGVGSGMLSSDGEWVYYLHDDGGNELGHIVRVPFLGGQPQDITPEMPPYGCTWGIAQSYRGNKFGAGLTHDANQILYIFDQDWVGMQVFKSENIFFGPVISYNAEIAVIASTEGTGSLDTKLLAFDLETGEKVAELWDGDGCSHNQGAFSPIEGDFRMISSTSKSGYTRPILWNPQTGARHELSIQEIPGEVNALTWSPDVKQVLLGQFHQAQQQLYLYDLESDSAKKLEHSPGVLGDYYEGGIITQAGEILITWQDPANPPCLISLDSKTGEKKRTILSAGDVPPGRPWRSVFYSGAGGAEVQAWLAVPDGEGPFPTIFHTHGGPTSVKSNYYAPESQCWLDHGYAFFTINFHGSTTFGKDFEKSILGKLGELEIQDMAAGYRWLVDQGIAKPDQVFLTGGSYGGFLTLFGLSRLSDLWAGGMAGVAIADWALMYEDESEGLRGYHRAMFGGSPEETPDAHVKSSPITYAADIQAPILVIQGSNDTRCPPQQMKVYEEKLKSLGKQIQVHWFEAGHGSMAQEQNIEHQELKLRFVEGVLEGKE